MFENGSWCYENTRTNYVANNVGGGPPSALRKISVI
jgi:hypothetical protein